ncbi:hypothetical protein HDV04_002692 [Boothiomyces sp. JEL0838]|nr:hypothetical protein HDV04_002692 [Boothiomyces sp. JEL0838]
MTIDPDEFKQLEQNIYGIIVTGAAQQQYSGFEETPYSYLVEISAYSPTHYECFKLNPEDFGKLVLQRSQVLLFEHPHFPNSYAIPGSDGQFYSQIGAAFKDWILYLPRCSDHAQREYVYNAMEVITNKIQILISNVPSRNESIRYKQTIVSSVLQLNQKFKFGLYLFDDNGDLISEKTCSTLRLYEQYLEKTSVEPVKSPSDVVYDRLHLFMDFISFRGLDIAPEETVEFSFAVYDQRAMKPLSEEFIVSLDHTGKVLDSSLKSCVFMELTRKLLHPHVYLLCQISVSCSLANLNIESKSNSLFQSIKKQGAKLFSKENNQIIRKLYGYSIITIAQLLSNPGGPGQMVGQELKISIRKVVEDQEVKMDWSATIDDVNSVEKLTLRISVLGGNLGDVTVPKACCRIPRNGNSDEVLPANDTNYIADAMFRGGRKSPIKEYNSIVFTKSSTSIWNETIRVDLPPQQMQTAHVFITFRNLAKSLEPTSFAFLPLMQRQHLMISDGYHQLSLYKYDSRYVSPENYLGFAAGPDIMVPIHLSSSSITSISKSANALTKLPLLENSFTISTTLFSTFFTQDIKLSNFLTWKHTGIHNRSPLKDVLLNFSNISEIEIAKFSHHIFKSFKDLFFEMGPHREAKLFDVVLPAKKEVMDAFISFFNTLLDVRFAEKLEYVLHQFELLPKFKSDLPRISELFIDVFRNTTLEGGKAIKKAVKSWHLILRLIFKLQLDDEKKNLMVEQLMDALAALFSQECTVQTLAIQTLTLQKLDSIVMELGFMDEKRKVKLLKKILDTIDMKSNKLSSIRLKLISNLYTMNIFRTIDAQVLWRRYSCDWVLESFGNEVMHSAGSIGGTVGSSEKAVVVNGTEVCLAIVDQIQRLMLPEPAEFPSEGLTGITSLQWSKLLSMLLTVYITSFDAQLNDSSCQSNSSVTNGYNTNTGNRNISVRIPAKKEFYDVQILLVTLGTIFTTDYLTTILIESLSSLDSTHLILQLIAVVRSFSEDDAFDKNQIGFHAIVLKATIRFLECVRRALAGFVVDEKSLASDVGLLSTYQYIWSCLLDLSVEFVKSNEMNFEEYSVQKQWYYNQFVGDLQLRSALLVQSCILTMEMCREKYQVELLLHSSFISNVFQIAISRKRVQSLAVDLVHDCFRIEFERSGNLKVVEYVCYETFHDIILQSDSKDPGENETFLLDAMSDKFKEGQGNFVSQGNSFLRSLHKFIPLVQLQKEARSYETAEFVASTLRLLRFVRHIKHRQLFVKYLQILYQIHMEHKNYIEAAITLKQQCELLQWSMDKLIDPKDTVGGFPVWQSEFDLNEQIHIECIRLLDEGQAWERAIELTRELEHQYEHKIFDYFKLSELLKFRVYLYDKISLNQRSFPTYYRVAFYGKGFTSKLSGKQFVFRGDNWEKLTEFTERIQKEYEPITVLKANYEIDDEVLLSNQRYMQITAVSPVSDLRQWKIEQSNSVGCEGPLGLLKWGIDTKNKTKAEDKIPLWLLAPELFQHDKECQIATQNRDSLPDHFRAYYENNEVSIFSYSKPVRRPNSEYDNHPAKEFLELYSEKTILITENALPYLSRRSKVIQSLTFQLSPIENAIISIRTKTQELLALEKKFELIPDLIRERRGSIDTTNSKPRTAGSNRASMLTDPGRPTSSGTSTTGTNQNLTFLMQNTNIFTMALKGAVDAPVNGGVQMYKNAFLNEKLPFEFPDKKLKPMLQQYILDQVAKLTMDNQDIPMEMLNDDTTPLKEEEEAQTETKRPKPTLFPTLKKKEVDLEKERELNELKQKNMNLAEEIVNISVKPKEEVTIKSMKDAVKEEKKKESSRFGKIRGAAKGVSKSSQNIQKLANGDEIIEMQADPQNSKDPVVKFMGAGLTHMQEHTLPIEKLAEKLRIEVKVKNPSLSPGLTSAQAAERLTIYGLNQSKSTENSKLHVIFIECLTNLFNVLLYASGIMYLVLYALRPERNFESGLIASNATVIRNGKKEQVAACDIVPGDIVYLKPGDKVPADCVLIQANELRVDGSGLTGESEPFSRFPVLEGSPEESNPFDSPQVVFSTDVVSSGEGYAIVVHTGESSIVGKIKRLSKDAKAKVSFLSKEIRRFIKSIALLALITAIIFFLWGLARGRNFVYAVTFGIGILIAWVPQGLPLTVTMILALSGRRMTKHNVLVKDLHGIETLGAITMLATDKTGTLTKNEMEVTEVWINGSTYLVPSKITNPKSQAPLKMELSGVAQLMHVCVTCSRAKCEPVPNSNDKIFTGDSTEKGLLKFAADKLKNFNQIDSMYPKVFEIAFSSDTKYHTTIHRKSHSQGGLTLHIKGAPEKVWNLCSTIWVNGSILPINADHQQKFKNAMTEMAQKGLRVLACGILQMRGDRYPDNYTFDHAKENYPKSDYTFLGLIGLEDPPKDGVAEAITTIRGAGIKVIMITGDNPVTAETISRQVNLVKESHVVKVYEPVNLPIPYPESASAIVISGAVVEEMTDKDWAHTFCYDEIIFARTLPSHKLDIVRYAQALGHIVAVTGDGVNDSAALKQADLGISMNKTGSDISKESARMILLDDNFTSTVKGIQEGRLIFTNLKKAIKYSLSHIMCEILPYLLYVIVPIPLPITPTQILAVDLGFELLMTLSFAWEPAEDDKILMTIPPRRIITNEKIMEKHDHLMRRKSSFNAETLDMFSSINNLNEADAESTELLNVTGKEALQKDFKKLNSKLQNRYLNYFKEAKQVVDKRYWKAQFHEMQALTSVPTGERLMDAEVLIWAYLEAGLIEFAGAICTYFAIFWIQFGISGEDARKSQILGNVYWKPSSPDLELENGSILAGYDQFEAIRQVQSGYYLSIFIIQVCNYFACKKRYTIGISTRMFSNQHMWVVLASGTVFALLVVYTPITNAIFITSGNLDPLFLAIPGCFGGFLYLYATVRRIFLHFGGMQFFEKIRYQRTQNPV